MRVYWSETYEISTNQSIVQVDKVEFMSNNWYGVTYYLTGSISINGSTVFSCSSSSGTHNTRPNSQGAFYPLRDANSNTAGPFASGGITHNNDGSKSITISATFNGYTINGNYGSGWGCSGSAAVVLTTIPRASSMSVGNGTLGSAQTIKVTRASTDFYHTIAWYCGTASGYVCTNSTEESISFTPSLDLAAQNVSATSVSMTYGLWTYSNGEAIGGPVYSTVTMAIPGSIVPSVSLSVSDANNHLAAYGGYIQNKSKAYAQASGAGTYGSSIVGYNITCGSSAVSAASGTFDLPTAGTITITATVTDSRGRQASKSTTINVLAHSAPSAWITSLYRQNQDGSANAQGAYGMCYFSGSVTSLGGKNGAAFVFKYRVKGGSWVSETLSDLAGNYSPSNIAHGFSADINSAYEVCIGVSDNFSYVESAYSTIQAISALLDFDKTKNAAGIGQRAQKDNTLSIGLYTEFLNGTNLPESGFKNLGHNVITNTTDDTAANWCALGAGLSTYSQLCLNDQPSEYGTLVNYTNGWEIFQIWNVACGGNYYRGGNGAGWSNTWRTLIDSSQPIHAATADSATYFANMYYSLVDGCNCILGTDGAWLNPLMYTGGLYKCKEHFWGRNVYSGVISCGCLPANTTKEIGHGMVSNFLVFDYGGFHVTRPNGTVTSSFVLPYRDYAKISFDKYVVRIETTYAYADSTEVFVWYKGIYL